MPESDALSEMKAILYTVCGDIVNKPKATDLDDDLELVNSPCPTHAEL